MKVLKGMTRSLAFALDPDAAGDAATIRGIEVARRSLDREGLEMPTWLGTTSKLRAEMKIISLPQGKDPDDVIRADAKSWQNLLDEALPIIDYAFNRLTSNLDLTTARDKSLAVDKLLPIIADIKDAIRRDHYLSKLARLMGTSYRSLEVALSRIKPVRPVRKQIQERTTRTQHPLLSRPIEEYCLALLLQHPELKNDYRGLSPGYFENTENREIFTAWQQTNDLSSLKEGLDPAIHEHLDSLIHRNLPPMPVEQRYSDCVLNLRKIYLKVLEAKTEEALTLAAESGGSTAELAKLEEQGVDVSVQLRELFAQERQRRVGKKEVTR